MYLIHSLYRIKCMCNFTITSCMCLIDNHCNDISPQPHLFLSLHGQNSNPGFCKTPPLCTVF